MLGAMGTELGSGCSKCIELEERNREMVDGFRVSVMDLEKKEKEARCETIMLRAQLEELNLKNLALQVKLEKSKSMCSKLGYEVVQLEDNLIVASESERLAKEEAEVYKNGCKELEVTVMNLEEVKCMCQKVDRCKQLLYVPACGGKIFNESSGQGENHSDLPGTRDNVKTPVQREEERRRHEKLTSDVVSAKSSSFEASDVLQNEGVAPCDQSKGKCATRAKKRLSFHHGRKPVLNDTLTISSDEALKTKDVILIDDSSDEAEFTYKINDSSRVDPQSGDSVVDILESIHDLKEIKSPKDIKVTNFEHCDTVGLDKNLSKSEKTPPRRPRKKRRYKAVDSDTEGEENVYDVKNNIPCGDRKEHGSPSESHGVDSKSGDLGVEILESLDHLKEIASQNDITITNSEHCDKMELDVYPSDSEKPFLPPCTPKNRRRYKFVASDTEEENAYDDNNIPDDRNEHGSPSKSRDDLDVSFDNDDREEHSTSRRRLVRLGHCKKAKGSRFPEEIKVDEVGLESHSGNGSGSQSESLGGFITSDSESENVSYEASEDEKDNGDFDEILKRLRRQKDTSKWNNEAEMQSSLGGSTDLCAKAVCALYRRQTLEEQSLKSTIYNNRRGFSAFDAERCSNLAVFLTDGNMEGSVKKSVQELEMYDSDGPDYCCHIALRYSKQLFDIYKNGEDSYFRP